MLRYLFSLVIIFSLLFSLQSCVSTDCASDQLRFSLVGFTDKEADSIILRKFVKDGNLNAPVDSAILDIRFNRSNDTLNIGSQLVNIQITSGYDYEFEFPVAGKRYHLTEIVEKKLEQKKSIFNNTKGLCVNPFTSLKVDNVLHIPAHSNLFYLRK